MPPDTVYVGRPGRFGNPFQVVRQPRFLLGMHWCSGNWQVEDDKTRWFTSSERVARRFAVWKFRRWISNQFVLRRFDGLKELRGMNLACWCRLDQPCHADVLLRIANDPQFTGVQDP